MGENVDEGAVARLHRARDFEQSCVGLRLHRGAAGIESEDRGNADDDAPADLQHVKADAGGLPPELRIESRHIGADLIRAERTDLRRAHLRRTCLLTADDIAEEIWGCGPERGE